MQPLVGAALDEKEVEAIQKGHDLKEKVTKNRGASAPAFQRVLRKSLEWGDTLLETHKSGASGAHPCPGVLRRVHVGDTLGFSALSLAGGESGSW